MKKYLIVIGLPLLFACNGADKKTVSADGSINSDSLNALNGGLSGQLQSKEAVIEGFLISFNEIQENLNIIKLKEKSVTLSAGGVEIKKPQQEQIISDIQFINDLLDKNRKAINTLREKLKGSDIKIGELEKTVSVLNTQVNEKEEEINFLKNRLGSLNIKLSTLDAAYEKEKKESAAKTEKLNTAYCSIGTSGDLIRQGIVTKSGGFIGVGKLKELDPNLTKGMFSAIDIYRTKEISIAAKKVKIITDHTKGSFTLDDKYGVKTLSITNPDEFWKTSKYLIIQVSGDKPEYE